MSPRIRTARPEDSTSIQALMAAVIRATIDDAQQNETIENVASNLEYWKSNPDQCVHLVAEMGSSIVGVILIKDFWNLCSLFVDVAHHRKGIGRSLMLEAMSACRDKSPIGAIFLNSSPLAVDFYSAMGFGSRQTDQALHSGVRPMRYDFVPNQAHRNDG